MKIVAFMQNMWLRDPERAKADIARWEKQGRGEEFRRRLITYALFAGCLTGRRLKQYLGDLTEQIIWDEASREITATASAKVTADYGHIKSVIEWEEPTLIIAFGRIASDALDAHVRLRPVPAITLIKSPHPAARNQLDQARFREAMQRVVALAS